MARLAKSNFAWFQEEVLYWMRFLGCFEWECRFLFGETDNALAQVECRSAGGIAIFTLANCWENDPISKYALSRVAFHEACEVLLCELVGQASFNWADHFVEQETHRVIRKLENTIFETAWLQRFPKEL